MRAVRLLAVALTTLVGGSACDRLPTDVPLAPSSPSAPTGLPSCAPRPDNVTYIIGRTGKTITFGSPCVQSTVRLEAHHSNYAVAW